MSNSNPNMSSQIAIPHPNPDLPEDIMIEIFSRLPTKSVGRCRCLSTTWRARLSNFKFAHLHFTRRTNHLHQQTPTALILQTRQLNDSDDHGGGPGGMFYTVPFPSQNDTVTKTLVPLKIPSSSYKIIDSCRGMVLLRNGGGTFSLFNPVTSAMQEVPIRSHVTSHGLFYDSVGNDFKIAVVRHPRRTTDEFVDVYSLKTGVWKQFAYFSRPSPCSFNSTDMVFVNGAIHWLRLTAGNKFAVAAVGLIDDFSYGEIPVPSNISIFGPFVLFGCLCLLDDVYFQDCCDIWVMQEYGLAESWTRIASIHYDILSAGHPLCNIGDDKIMFQNRTSLVVYNLKERVAKHINVNGLQEGYFICDGATIRSMPADSGQGADVLPQAIET